MPSLSVEPLSATPLAISSIASMPPAIHHNKRIADHHIGLEETIDEILALRRQLAGGIVTAALVADGVDFFPVRGFSRRGRRFRLTTLTDDPRTRRPSSSPRGIEHSRFHAGGDAPDHDHFGAGISGAQHVRRHVGLSGIDVGLIDHIGAVLLERRPDAPRAVTP